MSGEQETKDFAQQFCAPCGERGEAVEAVVWTAAVAPQTDWESIPEPGHEARRVRVLRDRPLCAECVRGGVR